MAYVCAEAPLFPDTPAVLGVPSSLNHQSNARPALGGRVTECR